MRAIDELSETYKKILSNHCEMVRKLEDQYQSIWRLTVSLSPPYNLDFEKHQSVISNVISEMLTEGGNQPVIEESELVLKELRGEVSYVPEDSEVDNPRGEILKDALYKNAMNIAKARNFVGGLAADSYDRLEKVADILAKDLLKYDSKEEKKGKGEFPF